MKRYIRSSVDPDKYCRRIVPGMYWNVDWHEFNVDNILGKTAKVTESWIAEDSGRDMKKTETWYIDSDKDGEFIYPRKYPKYHLHSGASANTYDLARELEEEGESSDNRDYDWDYEEDEDEDEGDYSPSNPWNAPGMSIRDFI